MGYVSFREGKHHPLHGFRIFRLMRCPPSLVATACVRSVTSLVQADGKGGMRLRVDDCLLGDPYPYPYHPSGQIIATSHDLTPNGGLVREIPLFQGNLGW